MQWLRNIVLLVAVAAGTVLAVARTMKTGGHVTAQQKEKPKSSAKRWAFRIAAVLLLAGFGGFLVVASGIMPIKASGTPMIPIETGVMPRIANVHRKPLSTDKPIPIRKCSLYLP